MNLGAPRARIGIGPEAPSRWRSNGRLRRCRACFAKRKERGIDSAVERREALSAPHVFVGAYRDTPLQVRCSLRPATHLQGWKCRKSPKGAFGRFLNRLDSTNVESGCF